MRMTDIIEHKKQGLKLTKEEIEFFVRGYTKGDIPDYQAAALAMAVNPYRKVGVIFNKSFFFYYSD